jgi:hypothetical protein
MKSHSTPSPIAYCISGTCKNILEALIKSVRGECFPFTPSIRRATRGTQDERKMYRTTFFT